MSTESGTYEKYPNRILVASQINAELFWPKVNKDGPIPPHRPELGPCWIFSSIDGWGYGRFSHKRTPAKAHRISWVLAHGIDAPPCLDHLCRNRSCVNPTHLEDTSVRINNLRGVSFVAVNFAKTHCVNGHEFTSENVYLTKRGRRHCKECSKVRTADWKRLTKYVRPSRRKPAYDELQGRKG